MQTNKKSGWVQSSSEMLAGLLGGINAVVAWLIILSAVFIGFTALASVSKAGMLALLSGVGLIAVGVVFAALLCGLVAMGYVIMKQSRYQSWLLQQMLNRQTLKAQILDAPDKMTGDM